MKARMVYAEYASACEVCDGPIAPGDPIMPDGDGGWMHYTGGCQTPPRPRPICDQCWLEKPCGCEET